MTMTRKTKATHTAEMIAAARTGWTNTRYASPIRAAAVFAEHGHYLMDGAAYRVWRMGRGPMHECRLDLAVELRGRLRRQQRHLGGRRITARVPGTKQLLQLVVRHEVERERTAHRPAKAYTGRRRAQG